MMSPKALADWLHDTAKTATASAKAVESMHSEHMNLRNLTLRAFEWRVARMMMDTMPVGDSKARAETMLLRAEDQLAKAIDDMMNSTLHPEAKK
jgi:hypothetical protein